MLLVQMLFLTLRPFRAGLWHMQRFLQTAVSLLKAGASNLARSRTGTTQHEQPGAQEGVERPQDALGRAEQLFAAGDYDAAASVLEGAEKVRARAWRVLLQCYQKMQRFEELCSTYESMPPDTRKDPTCRYFNVVAAVNLQRADVVGRAVDEVLAGAIEPTAAEFLRKVIPMAARLEAETFDSIAGRILSQREIFGEKAFAKLLEAVAEQRPKVSQKQAEQLFGAGDYNAAASVLEGAEKVKTRAWHILLQCYQKMHRFEDLCATYEAMPAEVRQDATCRYLYVTAAADLQRPDLVESVVADVLAGPDEPSAAEFLCRAFPIAARLTVDRFDAMAQRVLSHAEELTRDEFDAVLICAHYLQERGLKDDATRLETVLAQAASDPRALEKFKISQAQTHFLAGRFDRQLAVVNDALDLQGVDPVGLTDPGAALTCRNLTAAVARAPVRGPLVSILMPAFNSAETIAYAMESLRQQTYRDLEIIVVNDASSDRTAEIVSQVSEADPRVRFISLARNSGAYIARNTGLAAAAGEFVTNQDADDWAHPQKIACAVAELQSDETIVATWVKHVRCSGERGFRPLSGYIRPDASSLMFRRAPILNRMGWYDSVRAAGDGEFYFRMRRTFGAKSIRQLNKLLSFVSWSETSLSGGGAFRIDEELGILGPARSAYTRSFRLWHETTERLFMPFPLEKRPFPAPESLLAQNSAAA
jgi:tetratricopeptide (TPR) repeat protein